MERVKKANFLKNKGLLWGFVFSFVLSVFGLFLIVFAGDSPLPIVIRFDALRGVTAFGDTGSLWGIWIFSVCALVVNQVLSEVFYTKERLISFVFSSANIIISIFLIIVISLIIGIN